MKWLLWEFDISIFISFRNTTDKTSTWWSSQYNFAATIRKKLCFAPRPADRNAILLKQAAPNSYVIDTKILSLFYQKMSTIYNLLLPTALWGFT